MKIDKKSVYFSPFLTHWKKGAIILEVDEDIDVFMPKEKYGEFVKKLLEELGVEKCIFYIANENVKSVLDNEKEVIVKYGIKFKKGVIDTYFVLWDVVETKIIDKLISDDLVHMDWETYYFATEDVTICQTNDNFYYIKPKNKENYKKIWEVCKKVLNKMEV
jgi:hypothetical protein